MIGLFFNGAGSRGSDGSEWWHYSLPPVVSHFITNMEGYESASSVWSTKRTLVHGRW